jgi:hypothetical protein
MEDIEKDIWPNTEAERGSGDLKQMKNLKKQLITKIW